MTMIGLKRISLVVSCAALVCACGSSGRGETSTGGNGNGGGGGANRGGSGGSATGGSGGGAQANQCAGKGVAADGSKPMIDDFEDGNIAILEQENRKGNWWWSGDTGCTLTPSPFAPSAPSAGNASHYALHLTGTGCSSWGANTGFTINNSSGSLSCPYDASVYDGMSFWAIGAGVTLHVAVATSSTIPVSAGGDGTCPDSTGTLTCYDNFAKSFTLDGTWKQYHFAWSDLALGGWGPAVSWDASKLAQVSFGIGVGVSADFSIDDVRFYKGTVDTTPPAPGASGGAGGASGTGGAGGANSTAGAGG